MLYIPDLTTTQHLLPCFSRFSGLFFVGSYPSFTGISNVFMNAWFLKCCESMRSSTYRKESILSFSKFFSTPIEPQNKKRNEKGLRLLRKHIHKSSYKTLSFHEPHSHFKYWTFSFTTFTADEKTSWKSSNTVSPSVCWNWPRFERHASYRLDQTRGKV